MRYRVGDVARVLGLTPGALHYYEREGLVSAARAGGGQRYYDEADLWRLLSYRKYHAMGSSISEVMGQFTGGGARQTILVNVRARREDALKKARHYQMLARRIEEHLSSLERIDELRDAPAFERSPQMYFTRDEQGGWMAVKRERQAELNRWVEGMPAVRLAAVWPIHSFEEAELCREAQFGYAIAAADEQAPALSSDPGVVVLESKSCLHTVVTMAHDFVYHPRNAFLAAADYARARGFQCAGAPWGTILLVETDPQGLFRTYIELWIPIR